MTQLGRELGLLRGNFPAGNTVVRADEQIHADICPALPVVPENHMAPNTSGVEVGLKFPKDLGSNPVRVDHSAAALQQGARSPEGEDEDGGATLIFLMSMCNIIGNSPL